MNPSSVLLLIVELYKGDIHGGGLSHSAYADVEVDGKVIFSTQVCKSPHIWNEKCTHIFPSLQAMNETSLVTIIVYKKRWTSKTRFKQVGRYSIRVDDLLGHLNTGMIQYDKELTPPAGNVTLKGNISFGIALHTSGDDAVSRASFAKEVSDATARTSFSDLVNLAAAAGSPEEGEGSPKKTSPPSHKWSMKEQLALAEVRQRLAGPLAACPQFPEVVGDRVILRFLCARQFDIDATVKQYGGFLAWRKERNVDSIRDQIAFGGKNSPIKFPKGDIVIPMTKMLVMSAKATDRNGQPIMLEHYDFSPAELFKQLSLEEYVEFFIYCMEYRSMILEQLSEVKEREYLKEFPKESDRPDGYGVILMNCSIRNLKGVSMSHLSSDGRALLSKCVEIGTANYPEQLGKLYMVNTPWIFYQIWNFIKGLIDEATIAKIEFHGSGVNIPEMLKESIDPASVPAALGGLFDDPNESIEFEVEPGGALWHDGNNSSMRCSNTKHRVVQSLTECDEDDKPFRSCENLTLLAKDNIDLNFGKEEFQETLAAETRRRMTSAMPPSSNGEGKGEDVIDCQQEEENDVTVVGILVLTAQCSSTLVKAAMRDASLLTLIVAFLVSWLFWHSVVFWLALAILGTGFILNMFWGSNS